VTHATTDLPEPTTTDVSTYLKKYLEEAIRMPVNHKVLDFVSSIQSLKILFPVSQELVVP
jgi:hypothetical protein